MNKTEPKYRRPLNTEQIQILELLYKFRFVSATLLKMYYAKSNPGMNVFRRLETLEQQGLIMKRYFDNYRLLHKPVAYHLTPQGVRRLQVGKPILNARVNVIYKDKTVSEQFIQDCFDVFNIFLELRSHNDDLKFFSKTDLRHADYEYFPQPLPDAYVRLGNDKQYFLHVHYGHQPFFVLTRAIKKYTDYFENGVWDDTGTEFPIILFVIDNANIQKRLHKFMSGMEDLEGYTALKSNILNGYEKVWHSPDDPDKTYSLKELKKPDAI